jgi:hypothetical protein
MCKLINSLPQLLWYEREGSRKSCTPALPAGHITLFRWLLPLLAVETSAGLNATVPRCLLLRVSNKTIFNPPDIVLISRKLLTATKEYFWQSPHCKIFHPCRMVRYRFDHAYCCLTIECSEHSISCSHESSQPDMRAVICVSWNALSSASTTNALRFRR